MSRWKRLLKNLLYHLFPRVEGYNTIRILSGPARGMRMRIDIRDAGTHFTGRYDKWVFDRVRLHRLLRPGMVAWDCGAFYGYYACVFRSLVGDEGFVEVFEGSRRNHGVVSALPALNGWSNMRVHWMAVGPDHTTIPFTDNLGGDSGPYGMEKNFDESGLSLEITMVESSGVDELILERKVRVPDIVKFDLETAEIQALANGDVLFSQHRPLLLLELHGENAMRAAGDFLSRHRYRAYSVWELDMAHRSLFVDRASLSAHSHVPHMLLCFPGEKSEMIEDIYRI
jgi:FkbM family methyltransferase